MERYCGRSRRAVKITDAIRMKNSLILKVLKYVAFGAVVVLILMWLWSGALGQIVTFVRTIPNPIDIFLGRSTDSYQITLPWQVSIPQGPDLAAYDYGIQDSPQEQLDAIEQQYESLKQSAENLRVFGTPSPYAGRVSLGAGGATESGGTEYVELNTAFMASPVTVSGWSLQSALTGVRAYIPLGAPKFVHGALNSVEQITLGPGVRAIVSTSPSPVGVSFRESVCTGYLAQFQQFNPQLSNSCTIPSEAAPVNASNLQQYGERCMDYVRTMAQCHYPQTLPADLSYSCKLFIANTFSYNGCVATFRSDREFELDTWRIYLGSPGELWRNSHDVIRLLDAEGRTVDSVTY